MLNLSDYLKTAEAATLLGVSQNTLRKWAANGELPVHRNPANGYRLFKNSDLDLFLGRVEKESGSIVSAIQRPLSGSKENGDAKSGLNTFSYAKKLPPPEKVYVVDFFCGCGGMSWAFANTRQSHRAFEVLGGVDIDGHSLSTFRKNIPTAIAINRDIRELADNPSELEIELGIESFEFLRPLVFVGCPPCQGFSAHRKKDKRDDARNDLAIAFATLCDAFKPEALVIENVPEILKGRFAKYFDLAERQLKRSGYKIQKKIVDMSRYGVPQKRMRAVVFGSLTTPIEIPPAPLSESEVPTVRDAISHLPSLESGEIDQRDPSHQAPAHIPRIVELIKKIPADGGDRRSLPKDSQLKCHADIDNGKTPGFTDVYGRLRWDTPSVTITAKSSTPSCGRFLHPEQHRNISVREAGILQGFPQEYVFEGPFVHKYRQIGEAVPPRFARFVAWQMLSHFQGEAKSLAKWLPRKNREKRNVKADRQIAVVDAFCGAGGLTLGFESAGFVTKLAFDTNASAVATLNANLGAVAIEADVCSATTAKLIAASLNSEEPFVLVGGPPCQGFSQQRRGEDKDKRNDLVLAFADVANKVGRKPAAVVLENVTYLDSPRGKDVFAAYVDKIESLGFQLFRHDLNSAEYGVPQLRRRIVVVAIQKRYARHYTGPEPLTPSRWPTVGEFLDAEGQLQPDAIGTDPNHQASREGELNKRRVMFVDMGRGRLSIPEELQLACHKRYGGHLDVYGRLDWFSQARTITGGFDSFTRGEFAHPFFHRSITPREAARIQGFPDWFVFKGNRAEVRRQIGNAVPPPMAYAIGKAIANAIKKSR